MGVEEVDCIFNLLFFPCSIKGSNLYLGTGTAIIQQSTENINQLLVL